MGVGVTRDCDDSTLGIYRSLLSSWTGYPPIHDYALIGDCRTAGLISSRGSIDWLCLPRFDSPSCFNRLLDWSQGGYCAVHPSGSFRSSRRYRVDTAVLTTEFGVSDGRAQVTDLMPVAGDGGQRADLRPLRSVLRVIEGLEGTVEFLVIVKPRPDDGRSIPRFETRGKAGYCADLGGRTLFVAMDRPLDVSHGQLTGKVAIAAGEMITLWITYDEEAPTVYPRVSAAASAIDETIAYWTGWTDRCRYAGPYREQVRRSAITLKLLSYAPSGAIVASPTTSLPERIGGDLNWDYRYCWLRDASFTAHVFMRLGFETEAVAFMQWMTHATALTYPALQVLYTVHGESSISERTWTLFEGYRRSQPVRIGNAAASQHQLDVYGEVLDSLLLFVEAGHSVDRDTQRWIARVGALLTAAWGQPDYGIWEVRGSPRHYVHSKVMCWVALDRVERLMNRLGVSRSNARLEQAREALTRTVLKTGYSKTRRSFVQVLGGTHLDAAALTFGLTGFIGGRDPRMLTTIAAIQRWLTRGPLVYRYLGDQGMGREEGTFLPCSFWLVQALAQAGRIEEAEGMLRRLQYHANDVGLFPEEVHYSDGAFLGNFPLAWTHVGHISAILRLSEKPD